MSVDLDEIDNYHHIHGLPQPSEETRHLVYDLALPRLLSWAEQLQLPWTLFAVGRDLSRAQNARALRLAHEQGHEIGNHSQDHRYDLTRLSRAAMRAQVQRAQEAIEQATGARARGFRAPGYVVTDELLQILQELGFAYDSSVFPCPSYQLAKAAAMAAIRLAGRKSKSVLDTPHTCRAPREPYRLGRPFWRRDAELARRADVMWMWELPIQVTPRLRLPVIGTSLTLAGPERAAWLVRQCVGAQLINLEWHGIDALASQDGLQALAPHQPDLLVPLVRKHECMRAVVTTLRQAGYRFVTLEKAQLELERSSAA